MLTLYEPFAGSAALTLHLADNKPPGNALPILPYQGHKWALRHDLTARLVDRPEAFWLADAGPWGLVWQLWARGRFTPKDTAIRIAGMRTGQDNDQELWNRITAYKAPGVAMVSERVARFLILQRLAAGGKAVGLRDDDTWVTPGVSKSSALGVPATEHFGAVKPQLDNLLRRLRALQLPEHLYGDRAPAQYVDAPPEGVEWADVIVYLDPPYAGVTGYPGCSWGLTDTLRLANDLWERRKARQVLISEGRGLADSLGPGWEQARLKAGKKTKRNFDGAAGKQVCKATGEEWVTWRTR